MNNTLRYKLSQYRHAAQEELIPQLTSEIGPLTAALLAMVKTLDFWNVTAAAT